MTDIVWHLFDGPVDDVPRHATYERNEALDEEDDSVYAIYPRCEDCGDPNLSYSSRRCICCRAF